MMFKNAIVRKPCPGMIQGLTSATLGIPDYGVALEQHSRYIEAIQFCGLYVHVLEPDSRFPDSTFVEDVALCTSECAIITNPGAPSRNGERIEMTTVLQSYYSNIEVDPDEAYAANSLWINGTVLVPARFPKTREKIEQAGYKTITLEVSEFQKLDGGLSCLSLRF